MVFGVLAVVCLVVGLTALAVRLGHTPGPPRDSLHETDDGERANPFADLSDGAAASTVARCRECGDVVEASSYRLCGACLSRPLAGD